MAETNAFYVHRRDAINCAKALTTAGDGFRYEARPCSDCDLYYVARLDADGIYRGQVYVSQQFRED